MGKKRTHDEFLKNVYDLVENEYTVLGYYKGSKTNIKIIHNYCGYEYNVIPDKFLRGRRCPQCSDGISYPEKFIMNLLSQLNLHFEPQKIFDWCKDVDCENKNLKGKKRYDFYIPSLNCIIETHGEQHYKGKFNDKSLEDIQENDRLKEKLARQNNISKYIIINCSLSELEFVKTNILKSELTRLIDLSKINFLDCHRFACNSFVKTVSELWNNESTSTIEISKKLNICKNTVIKYLKQSKELGLSDYDSKTSMRVSAEKNGKPKRPVIRLSKEGDYLDEFDSIAEIWGRLNIKPTKHISEVCGGKRKSSGGYKWMYKEDYDQYIKQAN